MDFIFQEAYAPERISLLYEKICARYPKNEQYLTHLFMSYVRVRNYKQQQKTALALYKEFQRNPYYFWNVMSIVMQVNNFILLLNYRSSSLLNEQLCLMLSILIIII